MRWASLVFTLAINISCCRMLRAADITPPEVINIGLSQTNLDVSDSNQSILVTARVRDDLSGIGAFLPGSFVSARISVTFLSPSRNQRAGVGFGHGQRVSGNELDGIYTNTMGLPRYSEAGLWIAHQIFVQDSAGNSRTLDYAALLRLGISAEFHVTGTNDTTPPQIVTFSFSPYTVDVGSSNRAVNFTTRLRDDLSGMDEYFYCGNADFRSPSGHQQFSVPFLGFGRTNGDRHDGTYTNTVVLPQFCEPGIWTLQRLSAVDVTGNYAVFESGNLLALGFPMTVTVTGAGVRDTNAPILAGFSLTPTNVNTSFAAQNIEITTHITDDLSGFGRLIPIDPSFYSGSSASAVFASPSGRQSAQIGLGSLFPGVMLDVVYTNTLVLPRYSEPGLWFLQSLVFSDADGNRTLMDLAAVRSLGLPCSFMVEEFPPLKISLSGGAVVLSWPLSANGFQLQTSGSCCDPAAWNDLPGVPLQIGEEQVFALSVGSGQRFYRLINRP